MRDPWPMMTLFDKQIQLRMGQTNVRRWKDDLMPLVTDDADPLGVGDLATHHLPLEDAPHGYRKNEPSDDADLRSSCCCSIPVVPRRPTLFQLVVR